MMDFFSWKNNIFYKNEIIRKILFSIGLGIVGYEVLKFSKNICSRLFKFEHDMLQRYGENTYALVTGASAGMGKEFCIELAQRGFNIILVAGNPEKLERVAEELRAINPKIQTKVVVADFKDSVNEGFFEFIMEQIEGLEVSILVNNIGVYSSTPFHLENLQRLQDLVIINCLPQTMLTRLLLPKLLSRKKRSAIINLSSLAAVIPVPNEALYSASKAFCDYLSRSLAICYPSLDIISVKPGSVSSQMNNYRPTDQYTISAKELVLSALKNLGKTPETPGHFKHQFMTWKFVNFPCIYQVA